MANLSTEIYTEEERLAFREDTGKLVKHAKQLEEGLNALWEIFFTDSQAQKDAQAMFAERMREFIKDERLLKGFAPKFSIGCRRITPGKRCYIL